MSESLIISYRRVLGEQFPGIVIQEGVHDGTPLLDVFFVPHDQMEAVYEFVYARDDLEPIPLILHTVESTLKYYPEVTREEKEGEAHEEETCDHGD